MKQYDKLLHFSNIGMNVRNLKSDRTPFTRPPDIAPQMYGALIVLRQTAKLV